MTAQPLLWWGGFGMFTLAALCATLGFLDGRRITGVNRWLKPVKFTVSVGIFYWTLAWLLTAVAGAPSSGIIATAVFWLLAFEIACILVQAVRGVRSHFNRDTPLDGAIFGAMGLAILANTGAVVWLLALYVIVPVDLPAASLMGIRAGLLVFVLGSLQGFLMVKRLAHAVGAPDDGPGLPFLNWSRKGGDLRVAHFLGLHALQALPLCGYLLARWPGDPLAAPVTAALSLAYALVVLQALRQALRGRPLFTA